MSSIMRLDPFRGMTTLQEQINRIFDEAFRGRADDSTLATWAPAVDIFETENELVLRADLPGMQEKDLDIRVENNMLTIRGERKFDQTVTEDNYLRMERAYGTFSRSFSLPTTVNTDAIKADYQHGTLTVRMPRREETKPKQIKVSVSSNGK